MSEIFSTLQSIAMKKSEQEIRILQCRSQGEGFVSRLLALREKYATEEEFANAVFSTLKDQAALYKIDLTINRFFQQFTNDPQWIISNPINAWRLYLNEIKLVTQLAIKPDVFLSSIISRVLAKLQFLNGPEIEKWVTVHIKQANWLWDSIQEGTIKLKYEYNSDHFLTFSAQSLNIQAKLKKKQQSEASINSKVQLQEQKCGQSVQNQSKSEDIQQSQQFGKLAGERGQNAAVDSVHDQDSKFSLVPSKIGHNFLTDQNFPNAEKDGNVYYTQQKLPNNDKPPVGVNVVSQNSNSLVQAIGVNIPNQNPLAMQFFGPYVNDSMVDSMVDTCVSTSEIPSAYMSEAFESLDSGLIKLNMGPSEDEDKQSEP